MHVISKKKHYIEDLKNIKIRSLYDLNKQNAQFEIKSIESPLDVKLEQRGGYVEDEFGNVESSDPEIKD